MQKYNLKKEINKKCLSMYFRYDYIKPPETIFIDTYKLAHGEYLTFDGEKCEVNEYWDTFIKYNDPLAPYRNLILSSCIGTGKSTLTVCVNLYTAALFSLMWAPYKYYGYAPSTKFTIVFGGFSQKKASQLLFEPMKSVLLQSEFFK
jgi:hypothetical protein